MKTSLLNQLNKEITQGEREVKENGSVMCRRLSIAETYATKGEVNAHAISLTPQLIREVLELRKALCDVDYYLTGSGQGWINASNEGREAWKQVRAIVSKF